MSSTSTSSLTTPPEDGIDDDDWDYFYNNGGDLEDCYLDDEESQQLMSPPTSVWKDFPSNENPAILTFDSAKTMQWLLAKAEIKHVRRRMMYLLGIQEFNLVMPSSIILYTMGPDSEMGRLLMNATGMDEKKYSNFMSSISLQAGKLCEYHLAFCAMFVPN